MNAKSDKLERSYSKQLTEFAEQLQKKIADEELLDDIHGAIEDLLWDDESVAVDIRRIVEEQHKAGNLRDETFELVSRMLDRMVTEHVATAPSEPEPEPVPPPQSNPQPQAQQKSTDTFRDTTVIEELKLSAEADGDHLQVGSVLRDRFLLQEKVSGGSMGVVYKAMDRRLAEANDVSPAVAIKVLSPQLSKDGNALRALQQEAAKGRCLSHPNIVRFIDLDREEDLYFIVMEWLDGKSLADILDDSSTKKIDKEMALDIIRQLGKALDYAHRRGVIHADVKPGNIILSPSGDVKLFDFGIARVRQKQADVAVDFDPGVLGAVTPAYSSMQVLTGEEPVASDDVFSLACLMYRLIAGYRVFGPRNAAEAADEGMEPQRPQGLNDTEWRALRKALSYSRVSRFATPKEFMKAMSGDSSNDDTQPVAQLHVSDEEEGDGRRLWPALLTAGVLAAGLYGLYASGLLDQISAVSLPGASDSDNRQVTVVAKPVVEPEPIDPPVAEEADVPAGDETLVDDSDDETLVVELNDGIAPAEEQAPIEELIDFSNLPIATVQVPLAFPGTARTELDLILREDEAPAIVDLVRSSNIEEVLIVKLEEVSFSGNRSPWESGQYQISDDSVARFPAGQERARFTVSMTPDPLREPDRQVSLLVRDIEDSNSEYALINLTLEDDDQRRFESGLGPNTVAFAVGQVSVRERDPAVQIDLVRFNPDQTTLTVEYFLREVTATEGEDYFVPGTNTVEFGPGQRSARILIPLVQDSKPESDEAFMVEMPNLPPEAANVNIFRRIAVMIRDDDSKTE
jgi:serine/threonine protein kinase